MRNDDNKKKNNSSSNEKPVAVPTEVRVVGSIILACVGSVFLALTFRLVRWIAGF